MPEQQDARNHHQQQGDNPVKQLLLHLDGPACAKPRAKQAAAQQVDDDRPVRGDGPKGNRTGTEWQGGSDHDKAHRLVQNHGIDRRELERANQKGQDFLESQLPSSSISAVDEQ